MAKICETIANSQGGKMSVKDFMPDFKPHTKQTTNEQIGQQLSMIFGSRKSS